MITLSKKPTKLHFLPEEVNFPLLQQSLENVDTCIILSSSQTDEIGFMYDSGLAKERAHLIALYINAHRETILPTIIEELNLMKKPLSWMND